MGYKITIGNAEVSPVDPMDAAPESRERPRFHVTVMETTQEDAPNFPGDFGSQKRNERRPSYTQWNNVMETAGLQAWMYHPDYGVILDHPGCVPIDEEDLRIVTRALDEWQQNHVGAVPGFCSCSQCTDDGSSTQPHVDRDGMLARLLWLRWWIEWALKNCERPAIANS